MKLSDIYLELKKGYADSLLYSDLSLLVNIMEYEKDIDVMSIQSLVAGYEKSDTPTITCGIIVYNESKRIKKCLNSVKDDFNEIIVLDSYSTDDTVDIIKCDFPDVEIKYEKWKNDFSYARNKIIEYATSEWIYFIDADNLYSKENKGKIAKVARVLEFFSIDCVVSPYIEEYTGHLYSDTRRMFRLNGKVKFHGKVHEEPMNYNYSLPFNFIVNLKVYHNGYNPSENNIKSKTRRNINLTEEMLRLEPENPKWLFFFGRELHLLDKDEEAIDYLKKSINNYKKFNDQRHFIDALVLLCTLLLQRNNYVDLTLYLDILETEYPRCVDVDYFRSAILLVDMQNKLTSLSNMIDEALTDERYSAINTTKDHFKRILLSLNIQLENWERVKEISEEIKNDNMKKEIKQYLANSLHNIEHVLKGIEV
ncbi:SunS family peptide S-glycosyltransferase [Bacillus subtilis]|uniref:SunS family peptide S-glycosyltransferase n=1 Tax=Bacillus subtilis TaxID=1423 RepID=UPI002FFE5947